MDRGLQIWVVIANILKKQSRTADKGQDSGPGGITTPHRKTTVCYEMLYRDSSLSSLVNKVINIRVSERRKIF
jgi:hypothetical protein